MKRLLLIVLPLSLIVGCEKEPINYETTLVERDGVFYTQDTNEPYSGPVFSLYGDGKKKEEGTYKDGKEDGLWTYWNKDGQKWRERIYKPDELYSYTVWDRNGVKHIEGNYKDGKEDGLETWWYENGQKWVEGNYKDGEKDGKWTYWYENGQKRKETTYKDGKYISKKEWNEDGSVEE